MRQASPSVSIEVRLGDPIRLYVQGPSEYARTTTARPRTSCTSATVRCLEPALEPRYFGVTVEAEAQVVGAPGLRIVGIAPQSPADRSGLEPGMTIVKVDSVELTNAATLVDSLRTCDGSIQVELRTDDGLKNVEVVLPQP